MKSFMTAVFAVAVSSMFVATSALAQGAYSTQEQQRDQQRMDAQSESQSWQNNADKQMKQDRNKQSGLFQEDQSMNLSQRKNLSAEDISGTELYAKDNTKVGEIEEVTINRSNGKVENVIIGTGGVLGMGESYYLVPWNKISFEEDRAVTQLSMEEIKTSPSRDSLDELDEWVDEYDQGSRS